MKLRLTPGIFNYSMQFCIVCDIWMHILACGNNRSLQPIASCKDNLGKLLQVSYHEIYGRAIQHYLERVAGQFYSETTLMSNAF